MSAACLSVCLSLNSLHGNSETGTMLLSDSSMHKMPLQLLLPALISAI